MRRTVELADHRQLEESRLRVRAALVRDHEVRLARALQFAADVFASQIDGLVGVDHHGPLAAGFVTRLQREVPRRREVVDPLETPNDKLVARDLACDLDALVGDARVDQNNRIDPRDDASDGLADRRLVVARHRDRNQPHRRVPHRGVYDRLDRPRHPHPSLVVGAGLGAGAGAGEGGGLGAADTA